MRACGRVKRKKIMGIASIEFAMGFILFWYMCAAWMEMSFMSYVSSLGDLAISRAAQVAKKNEGSSNSFSTVFNNALKEDGSIWQYVVDSENFSSAVIYLKTYEELTNYDGTCEPEEGATTVECGDADGSAIAIYRINYSYTPLFNYYLADESMFSREMIVIQEYQREQFAI